MADIDPNIEGILEECHEAYAKADTHQSLDPPGVDGDYTCELIAVREGSGSDSATGAKYVWLYPVFKVIDGEFSGREFRGSFMGFSTEDSDRARGNITRLKEFGAVCNNGNPLPTIKEAYALSKAATGEFFRINISTSTRGNRFVNVRELLTSSAAPTEVPGAGTDTKAEETPF